MKSYSNGCVSLSFLFILFCLTSTSVFAKTSNDSIVKPQVRSSPIVIANLKTTENNYVKCTYGQPLKKGREIFGNLVPYGKLWRTGANEATEITFTTNIQIGETQLPAGTYTLFTVPNKEKWTIIFNSELGQWGDFSYDSNKNVLNFEANVSTNTDIYEGFTIQFEDITNGFNMLLLWDNVKVTVPIQKIGELAKESKKKKKRRN
ncbi:hypothetical protein GCM10011514_11950 [Emticicia aquatilis]|uniref:DUF2911 domain-containing protein n=1 Tax=Emticicia aquatilis TaxID=1537369 RepID=A0A916YK00_9BACT|nr:DUF2911 domain-containing protein [Emticicia aquatilis]GGD49367.1 hypothetical protein GCM10011514_11950 [Emticicia aquatilis]